MLPICVLLGPKHRIASHPFAGFFLLNVLTFVHIQDKAKNQGYKQATICHSHLLMLWKLRNQECQMLQSCKHLTEQMVDTKAVSIFCVHRRYFSRYVQYIEEPINWISLDT